MEEVKETSIELLGSIQNEHNPIGREIILRRMEKCRMQKPADFSILCGFSDTMTPFFEVREKFGAMKNIGL
jgi:hypothetical protein